MVWWGLRPAMLRASPWMYPTRLELWRICQVRHQKPIGITTSGLPANVAANVVAATVVAAISQAKSGLPAKNLWILAGVQSAAVLCSGRGGQPAASRVKLALPYLCSAPSQSQGAQRATCECYEPRYRREGAKLAERYLEHAEHMHERRINTRNRKNDFTEEHVQVDIDDMEESCRTPRKIVFAKTEADAKIFARDQRDVGSDREAEGAKAKHHAHRR